MWQYPSLRLNQSPNLAEPEPEAESEPEQSFEPVKMIKLMKNGQAFYNKNSRYYDEVFAHTKEEFMELKRKRYERYDYFDTNSIF